MIEEEFRFPFSFISPVIVSIEETAHGVALIHGTLLAEGVSRNKNLYTIDEMPSIAQQAVGLPIYVGVTTKKNPNTSLLTRGMHDNADENRVGIIMESFFDSIKRRIRFIAQIVNTAKFPDIISKIKKGWGISIGGVATAARHVISETHQVLTKIAGLLLDHVQLIPPETIRGQDEAKVEGIEIQETMTFYVSIPKISISEVILGIGTGKVEISY